MRQEPVTDGEELVGEDSMELSLRPQRLGEFIGQEDLKGNLSIFLKAALQRQEPLDHLLLYGPPGLGKTTLAHIVAYEMGATIHVTSGPAIQIPGDLVGILTNLDDKSILFIDEIHRLSRPVEEILYPAMEDRKVDILIGKGPAARSIRMDVPSFTVIGATTRQGLLTGPLRDRFGIILNFGFYDPDALEEIILRSSHILGLPIEKAAAGELARRSRGTPRIANRLLKRVRDFAQVAGEKTITLKSAQGALSSLGVDDSGLDRVDRAILTALIQQYQGGPVGLETLAATIGEDSGTLEDVYEPYLIQRGFLARTPRGRQATQLAWTHLGLTPPPQPGSIPPIFGEE
jgi:Holliday junction DNA helicase RuvB